MDITPEQKIKRKMDLPRSSIEKIRSSYKHKRMQSKNMLVNQYRSLSLKQGDNLEKYLKE